MYAAWLCCDGWVPQLGEAGRLNTHLLCNLQRNAGQQHGQLIYGCCLLGMVLFCCRAQYWNDCAVTVEQLHSLYNALQTHQVQDINHPLCCNSAWHNRKSTGSACSWATAAQKTYLQCLLSIRTVDSLSCLIQERFYGFVARIHDGGAAPLCTVIWTFGGAARRLTTATDGFLRACEVA
jgi:hypothetical protein